MVKMMRETAIAFGLTMVICLALFFYCWYIRKLRNRLLSAQVSATPFEANVNQEKTGIEKDVVATFPTVKTHELRLNIKDELQCPICLVEYGNGETLRKLPHCGHVFHIHCVDAWLANQVTCPVCRIELTNKPQLNAYNCSSRTPSSITIEVAPPKTPAWVLVNRPLPLPPPAAAPSSDNISIPGPAPTGWGAVFLQRTAFSFRSQTADTAIIESKDVISHSSISERWMTESFSFGKNPTSEAQEVAEMYSCSSQHGHLPLTASPEHCAFEFLPIVTARGGDSSSRRASR